MKIIALGDNHGRDVWKSIVTKESFDKLIFIGDYFDSVEGISPNQQIHNFKEIIKYKEENAEKVILLIGNHDYHYFKNTDAKYSQYQESHASIFQNLLEDAFNKNFLQMSYLHENILFTHAGVTKTWCKNNAIDLHDISNSINQKFMTERKAFSFTMGVLASKFGDDKEQSPIWVRPFSLVTDKIDGYVQVVGHTKKDNLLLRDHINLIDCLGTSKEYFIWEDWVKGIGQL